MITGIYFLRKLPLHLLSFFFIVFFAQELFLFFVSNGKVKVNSLMSELQLHSRWSVYSVVEGGKNRNLATVLSSARLAELAG